MAFSNDGELEELYRNRFSERAEDEKAKVMQVKL